MDESKQILDRLEGGLPNVQKSDQRRKSGSLHEKRDSGKDLLRPNQPSLLQEISQPANEPRKIEYLSMDPDGNVLPRRKSTLPDPDRAVKPTFRKEQEVF